MIPEFSNEKCVGVVGLGYVGLPLVVAYSSRGFRTIGFDIDPMKVDAINARNSYIKHIPAVVLEEAGSKGELEATVDFRRISECDSVILCVPTPLNRHFEPDLSYVRGTLDSVVPHLKEGAVISLESTTYPGTTAEEIVPRVEKLGRVPGRDVFVVYSPEREDPGNSSIAATKIPKVVGGHTQTCLAAGKSLYEGAFDEIVPVSSTQVAELTKLLENIYRSVNIGLVNEMKVAADKMGIDIWEVINAAATKPFGFKPFYPGPGLGGHCIPIDPFYMSWKAREFGVNTHFIELSGEVNRAMPDYVVGKTVEALNSVGKPVKGSRILVLGLAYKADVDDLRESPTFSLLDKYAELGAEVGYHDPHIPRVGMTREHKNWAHLESTPLSDAAIGELDCIVISTNHSEVDLQKIADWDGVVVDTRNAMAKFASPSATVWRA
ncbi:MAG: nucleotide sugar dehydrogenase [Verrucomicrobiota bacterium]